ncbi:MAG: hypothetical protein J6W59_05950 [Bacteroidales bacterium]|nr:hypothetical protein [Bacteroidales bacterium]
MTDAQKLERVKTRIPAADLSEITDEELLVLIDEAGELILNRMYPFARPSSVTRVPARYENIQTQIAIELVNRKGAEGEMSHSENGTVRSYESGSISSSLLKKIMPHCGSSYVEGSNDEESD